MDGGGGFDGSASELTERLSRVEKKMMKGLIKGSTADRETLGN